MNTEVVEPSSETLAPPAAYPRGRWTMLSNPFHRKPAAKRAEAPVQGELALDMVKVVRNDLSEADLEIVPGRPPEPAPSEPVLTAGTAETDGVLWNRIASRFFGSRET